MASGKSTLLKNIKSKNSSLSVYFVDLEEEIEYKVGESVPKVIQKNGMDYFREVEFIHLDRLLKSPGAAMIALGGGALHKKTLDLIRFHGGVTIWLKTPFPTCLERIRQFPEERPLARLSDHELRELYNQRVLFYKQADLQLTDEDEDKLLQLLSSDTID